jgi:hypothetical protein
VLDTNGPAPDAAGALICPSATGSTLAGSDPP